MEKHHCVFVPVPVVDHEIEQDVALSGQQTLVELHASRTNEVCTMYIEEFILVDIWIHCCASWNCTVLYCTRS